MLKLEDRHGRGGLPIFSRAATVIAMMTCGVLSCALHTAAAGPIAVDNASSLSPVLTWATDGVPVFGCVFSPDDALLYGAQGNAVVVWNPADGTILRSWRAHPGYAAAIDLSPDGLLLATSGDDAVVRVWDAATGDLLHELSPAGTHAVSFSHDGSLIGSADRNAVLRVWDVQSGELLRSIDAESRMFSVAFSPDDAVLVTAHGRPDFAVRTWSAETGELLWEAHEHGADAHVVRFSPSGEVIASVGADTVVVLYDAATGDVLHTLRGHRDPLFEALFLGEALLATGDGGGRIRLWDIESGRLLKVLTGHQSEVCALAVTHDGTALASASFDMKAILWRAPQP